MGGLPHSLDAVTLALHGTVLLAAVIASQWLAAHGRRGTAAVVFVSTAVAGVGILHGYRSRRPPEQGPTRADLDDRRKE